MKTAIITTTINVPVLFRDYMKNVKDLGHDCFFVVIGDKKTPAEAKSYCLDLGKEFDLPMTFLDVADQEEYLNKHPELGAHLTWNSIQRRNIGLVIAYEQGAEQIITIDDDNFFVSDDFVMHHSVGQSKDIEILSTKSGWLNVCNFLTEKYNRPFYHRGYPLEQRFADEEPTTARVNGNVVVNAGFWFGDPDIDALTRIYYFNKPIEAVAYERGGHFALAHGTWSPFNSQNTSLAREIIPAYFLSPYIGRYDDIWAAYVIKRISDHLGDYITFGDPVVKQERNVHNYWKDLAQEDKGMMLTTPFVEMLKAIPLSGTTYSGCFKEISDGFKQKIAEAKISDEHRMFLQKYQEGMEVWIKTFEGIQ